MYRVSSDVVNLQIIESTNQKLSWYDDADKVIETVTNPNAINITSFIPESAMLHFLYRPGLVLQTKVPVVKTPSLNDFTKIMPIPVQYMNKACSYDRFKSMLQTRIGNRKQYCDKLVNAGVLAANYAPRGIFNEHQLFCMVQKLVGEQMSIRHHQFENEPEWLEQFLFEPCTAGKVRTIWAETPAECNFVNACTKLSGDAEDVYKPRFFIDASGGKTEWKMTRSNQKTGPVEMDRSQIRKLAQADKNPLTQIQELLAMVDVDDKNSESLKKKEAEMIQQLMQQVRQLISFKKECDFFRVLDNNANLLSQNCLPLINDCLNMGNRRLAIREIKEVESQVDYCDVEWTDSWSESGTQTDEIV